MQLTEMSNIGTVKLLRGGRGWKLEGWKKKHVRVICDLLACVNIIKSTSTTRCRRQSVFDIERTNRQSLGRTNHNPPVVLLRPMKRFWTSQLKEKDAVAFSGNFLFAPSIQTETFFE